MNTFMETLGWYLCLAAVIVAGSALVKAFLEHTVASAKAGTYGAVDDTLVWLVEGGFIKARQNAISVIAMLATFFLILFFTESSVFTAVGFAALSFFIGAFLTPFFMKRAKVASAVESAPAVSQVKIDPDLH